MRDVAAGTLLLTLEDHQAAVTDVAFSPRGDLIATASHDDTARLWDPATGACHAILAGHDDDVNAVAFAPRGDLLASRRMTAPSASGTSRTPRPLTVEALVTARTAAPCPPGMCCRAAI